MDAPPDSPPIPLIPVPRRDNMLRRLGPGLITGAADDDPSGIATYSQVGAQFGYGLAWTMLFSLPFMIVIQLISGRIGCVTGQGIADNLRRHYSMWLLRVIVLLLLVANVINLGADLGAMGAALALLLGGSSRLYTIGFGILCVVAEIFISYAWYAGLLKWLTVFLFSYVAVVFAVHVPWGEALTATLVPKISFDAAEATALVAVLGTTISPYLFFWQAALEVEELRRHKTQPLKHTPNLAKPQFARIRTDTVVGMVVSNVIAIFIIFATAATLHASGVTNIQTSSQAAEALRPIAGEFTFLIFAAGIIGTGLLAVPVLAGSAAYAVSEAFQWREGLDRRLLQAKSFYATIAVATMAGIGLNFTSLDPVKALYWSAVVNGVLSAPVMAVVMLIASNRRIMGTLTIPRPLQIVGWLATAIMLLASIGFFVL
jgi:NRAMP (natural resistance-associated macrophage protein)-like metal ion transporter